MRQPVPGRQPEHQGTGEVTSDGVLAARGFELPQTAAERPDLGGELLAGRRALVVVQASQPAAVDRIPQQATRELPQSGGELLGQPGQQGLAGVTEKAFEQCLLKGEQPRRLVRS